MRRKTTSIGCRSRVFGRSGVRTLQKKGSYPKQIFGRVIRELHMSDDSEIEYSPIETFAGNTRGGGPAAVFVSPGRYVHPQAYVEDMYRPGLFARQARGEITVLRAGE